MKIVLSSLIFLFGQTGIAQGKDASASDIMARVALNQDRAEAERSRYVYVQHARVASRKGRTLRCEEVTDSRVTPGEQGSFRTLLKLDGRVLRGGRYVTYDQLPQAARNDEESNGSHESGSNEKTVDSDETDRDLVEHLRKNLTDDKSKSGLHAGLFPLTSIAQAQYIFRLIGRERRNGVDVFHVTFIPRDKDDYGWRGDAWIDVVAFQPVVVQTAMSKNLPLAVRTLMGTNVPGLGFAATYAAQPDGVWFPVSFGGEFKLNVLFFFHRTITVAIDNRNFEKTRVSSHLVTVDPAGEVAP